MRELVKCGDVYHQTARKKVDTWKALPNPMNDLVALTCNVCHSLTSQTEPIPQKGKLGSGKLCIQVVSHWNAIS